MHWAIIKNHVLVVQGANWGFMNPSSFQISFPDIEDDEIVEAAKEFRKNLNRSKGVPGLADDIAGDFMAVDPVGGSRMSLSTIIINLNDGHGWTREQIADWLDTLPDQPKWKLEDTL